MKIILASQSPRRKEILEYFQIQFTQYKPPFDEDSIPFCGNPLKYVEVLTKGKGESLIHRFPNDWILSADTIVHKKGVLYGKPTSQEESIHFLRELAGGWHEVITGVSMIGPNTRFYRAEETKVRFHSLSEIQLQKYTSQLYCEDKAGGYMIQGAGSLIVKEIAGCYYNVLGLPLDSLREAIQLCGIDLWDHLKNPV